MAVEYGMSLFDELKEALEKRKDEAVLDTYYQLYDEFIQEQIETYQTEANIVCTAIYLASYIMDRITVEGIPIHEMERARLVLRILLQARKILPINLEAFIELYRLIYDWANKIEIALIQNARLLIDRKVILTNLTDVYAVSLFSFLEKVPEMDLRWAMAELMGALMKRPSTGIYEDIQKNYPVSIMEPQFYFDAGAYILRPYIERYFEEKVDSSTLEAFGDIGQRVHEFACSLFYQKDSRELFVPPSFSHQLTLNEQLIQVFQDTTAINSSVFRKTRYKLAFAKFYVQLKTKGQTLARHFFLHNIEEDTGTDKDLGTWVILLLSTDNINLESLNSYAKQRFIDVRGVKERNILQTPPSEEVSEEVPEGELKVVEDPLFEAWNEAYLNNLQEEYEFLSIPDTKREQKFLPFAVFQQERGKDTIDLLFHVEKSEEKKRKIVGLKDGVVITKEEMIKLIDHMTAVTRHALINLRLFLLEHDEDVTISFWPEEFLYEHERAPEDNVLMMFAKDESRVVSIIARNELVEFSANILKPRQITSKIQQLLTELRVKSLEETCKARLEQFQYIIQGVTQTVDSSKLWFEGHVTESVDMLQITETLEAAKREKEAEEEAERRAQLERLKAIRHIYLNDVVLKRFYDETTLTMQKTILTFLEELLERFEDSALNRAKIGVENSLQTLKTKIEEQKKTTEELDELIKTMKEEFTSTLENTLPNLNPYLTKLKKYIEQMDTDELIHFV